MTTVTNLVPTKARFAIVISAVISVSLTTVNPVTLMPPPKDTFVVLVKFVPVRVTPVNVAPWLPVAGLTPVTVGASEVTENPAAKVPRPAGVPTPTKRVPTKARLAITMFAVI